MKTESLTVEIGMVAGTDNNNNNNNNNDNKHISGAPFHVKHAQLH